LTQNAPNLWAKASSAGEGWRRTCPFPAPWASRAVGFRLRFLAPAPSRCPGRSIGRTVLMEGEAPLRPAAWRWVSQALAAHPAPGGRRLPALPEDDHHASRGPGGLFLCSRYLQF